jgi:hypothetical protein
LPSKRIASAVPVETTRLPPNAAANVVEAVMSMPPPLWTPAIAVAPVTVKLPVRPLRSIAPPVEPVDAALLSVMLTVPPLSTSMICPPPDLPTSEMVSVPTETPPSEMPAPSVVPMSRPDTVLLAASSTP